MFLFLGGGQGKQFVPPRKLLCLLKMPPSPLPPPSSLNNLPFIIFFGQPDYFSLYGIVRRHQTPHPPEVDPLPDNTSGYLLWTRFVRSPPSSRIMLRGLLSGHMMVCSMHHAYSSSVSPFQAYTATPVLAMAAAAWSCVEKMLQELHWTWRDKQRIKK